MVRSTSQQHHYLVRLFQILPFEWFRLHCLYSCIAWGKIHYILNWMICYELRSALNIRICPCLLLCLKWFIYLKLLQVLSNDAKLFLQIQDFFLTQRTSEKSKTSHVMSLSKWNVTKYICPFEYHKSYLSLLLSSSPSIVASFLAMSSYFLSDSAIVNLSSFNWPSSLSPEKIGITRLLSFRENGKFTWRCYVEIFHEIHLVLHWRCSSFLASDALWLPCRL